MDKDVSRGESMFELTAEEERELIATRRDLHRHPETAFQEKRTASIVADRLRALGLEPRTGIGGTGVTASLPGKKSGKRLLLRADMDALPVQEESDEDYCSTVKGAMHGCGHDGHTAILLTAAGLLTRTPPAAGGVELVFQPAEEIANGALAMIETGMLEENPVDAAVGLHLWNSLDIGKVAVTAGPVMAAADEFNVRIIGVGCHAASPQEGRDPILAAAHVVSALQQIPSRRVAPLGSVVVTVGSIHGGDTFNVIPEEVRMNGTVRSFDNEVYESIPGLFEEVVHGAAATMGCRAEIEYLRSARPVINDAGITELVREVAIKTVGAENVIEERTMGAEDFGEFLYRVPGSFFFVGSKNDSIGRNHPHHSPKFDFDEAALSLSARLLVSIAHRYLETA